MFASLANASGADVKVLQSALGHASAAMTLDVYANRMKDKATSVAEAMARLVAEG